VSGQSPRARRPSLTQAPAGSRTCTPRRSTPEGEPRDREWPPTASSPAAPNAGSVPPKGTSVRSLPSAGTGRLRGVDRVHDLSANTVGSSSTPHPLVEVAGLYGPNSEGLPRTVARTLVVHPHTPAAKANRGDLAQRNRLRAPPRPAGDQAVRCDGQAEPGPAQDETANRDGEKGQGNRPASTSVDLALGVGAAMKDDRDADQNEGTSIAKAVTR
jgi:hypothetical protein